MKFSWETMLFKLVLQAAVSIPCSYDWSLSWNQSPGCSKLQLQNQNGDCYPSITVRGGGLDCKKGSAGIEEKLVVWKVIFLSDTPPGISISILCKSVNATLVFP